MEANDLTISHERWGGTPIVGTAAERLAHVSVEQPLDESFDQDQWDRFVDEKLIEWGRNAAELFAGDIDPPTKIAISAAATLAHELKADHRLSPTRVVPDACGGIAFELVRGPTSERFEIAADGSVEYLRFVDCRLVQRYEVSRRS
jgi:hypothetical protein